MASKENLLIIDLILHAQTQRDHVGQVHQNWCNIFDCEVFHFGDVQTTQQRQPGEMSYSTARHIIHRYNQRFHDRGNPISFTNRD